jgi:2-amino-4-hydroxy-6-hydroxymethyldihydropteridine diphosphokinase
MNQVVLIAGGNLGNRMDNLLKAELEISNLVGEIAQKSSVYETEAWGFTSDMSFLNQVFIVQTALDANEVLSIVLDIELNMGRERKKGSGAYSSRSMDIDILFFNEHILKSENLEVPHPRLHLRRFVLAPLNELIPHFKHPIQGKTIEELLKMTQDHSKVSIYERAD